MMRNGDKSSKSRYKAHRLTILILVFRKRFWCLSQALWRRAETEIYFIQHKLRQMTQLSIHSSCVYFCFVLFFLDRRALWFIRTESTKGFSGSIPSEAAKLPADWDDVSRMRQAETFADVGW